MGILPALVTLWIRKGVPESEMWKQQRTVTGPQSSFWEIFSRQYRKNTVFLLLLNVFGLFAWWGKLPHFDSRRWLFPYLFMGLVIFILGGLTGLINASYGMNAVVHNTS